uniref:Late nodulin domain-containing protein n=1 Tax=Medicago truncatula TaxID=3880 RepID=I3T3M9_MEDTR|nr:unknown [Medicago truncatula]
MAEIVKLIYVMIIFFYVFLVSMNVDASDECVKVSDCSPTKYCLPGRRMISSKGKCKCLRNMFIPIPE